LGRDPGEARALAAAAGDNFCRVVAEYWRIDGLAARPDRVRVVDAAPLAQARARGRGVVIASAHFGNWEAIRLAARAATGEECALIYRAFNNPAVDAVAQRFIAVAGRPVLHKGREGTRALLRHVARGGTALVLVDQRQTGAPLLPFLGREAETATAAADLARRFDAALLTACARRRDDGLGFDVTFQAEATGDTAEAMMAEVNGRIGAWIDADPGQWFWLHRRWVRRGRGDRIRAARSGAAPQG
ncbi:MAG: lysophospholipid acyltransferase family protein, partial [Pseudomonadota bacterium]